MKASLHIIAVIIAVVLTSCEKEIDFKYHDIDPLPVIEANLTPKGMNVAITYTTPMGEPMDLTPVTDAAATLTDVTDGCDYALSAGPDGAFGAETAFSPVTGHDYRLNVTMENRTYEAVTTMYPATEITSVEFSWIKMPYDQVAVLQVQFRDIPSMDDECYWIKIYRNDKLYCWGEITDRATDEAGIITYITMTTRRDIEEEDDDSIILDGDIITANVSVISHAMYDYLQALCNDSNGPAMFSGPLCLGYFLATSPVEQSTTFHR